MSDDFEDAELAEIEQRAARAFAVAPAPWIAQLETRQPIGAKPSYSSAMTRLLIRSCTSGCTRGRARSPRLTSASMQLSTSLPTHATRSRG